MMKFNLPLIPSDKANHFIYGLMIFTLCSIPFGWIVGIISCSIFGIGKEIYDEYNPNHTPDVMDAIYTIAGGVVGLACVLFG